jgi:hypothetical protein
MVHCVDAAEKVRHEVAVADVALEELDLRAHVSGRAATVDGGCQGVEDDDLVAERQ